MFLPWIYWLLRNKKTHVQSLLRRSAVAKLVKVYTILPDTVAADDSFNPADPFPVVRMEIKAANYEWAAAAAYQVRGWVTDVGVGIAVALGSINGVLQDANWNTQNGIFEFALPAAITDNAATGGFVQVKGWVRVGAPGPGTEVDFGSTEFVWA